MGVGEEKGTEEAEDEEKAADKGRVCASFWRPPSSRGRACGLFFAATRKGGR
jgi:hypothetical protein